MEEYLPPIITKLKADLSDLVAGLAEARALVRDYAAGSHKDMIDAYSDAGRDSGAIFGREFGNSSSRLLHGLQDDVKRGFTKAGDDSGGNFVGSFFRSVGSFFTSHPLVTLILASLLILGPALGGLIASAFALAFAGIAGFILKSQPPLIAAALRLKQTVVEVFKDAALPMLDPLVKALDIFTALVKELGPAFKTAFGYAAQTVVPLAQGIASMFRNMMPGLNSMLSKKEVVEAFAKGLGALGSGLGDFFQQIAEHGPELARFMTDFMIALANVVRWLGYFIDYLVQMYDAIHKGSVAVGKGIRTAVTETGHFVEWAIGKVSDLIDWIVALPGRIANGIVALPGILGSIFQRAFDFLMYIVGFGIGSLIQYWVALPGRIGAVLSLLWSVVVGWAIKVADGFRAWWDSIPERVAKLQDLPGKIKSWFADAGKWLWQAGKDLIYGLGQGILDGVDWAVSEVKRAIEKIKEGARDALGIHSPSTVFAEMGRYTMQGYIQGLLSQRGTLGRIWERMGMPAMPSPALAIAGGSATALAATAAPSYRPSGAGGRDGALLPVTINLEGNTLMTALVPVAQKQKARTGTTGLS